MARIVRIDNAALFNTIWKGIRALAFASSRANRVAFDKLSEQDQELFSHVIPLFLRRRARANVDDVNEGRALLIEQLARTYADYGARVLDQNGVRTRLQTLHLIEKSGDERGLIVTRARIKRLGGPVQTSCTVLSKLWGMSVRQLLNIRAEHTQRALSSPFGALSSPCAWEISREDLRRDARVIANVLRFSFCTNREVAQQVADHWAELMYKRQECPPPTPEPLWSFKSYPNVRTGLRKGAKRLSHTVYERRSGRLQVEELPKKGK